MYVDYVQYTEKDHMWLTPIKDYDYGFTEQIIAIKMVEALYEAGISKYEFNGNTHYQEFKKANLESLEILDKKGLLKKATDETYSFIISELPFPLYKEEFKMKKVSIDKLREVQAN